jgi:hypothetical protein
MPPMHERIILKPIEVIENICFLNICMHKQTKYFDLWKNNNNENIDHSLNFKFFKHLWEYICIKFEKQINEATLFF